MSAALLTTLVLAVAALCALAFRLGRASTRREALRDALTGLPNRALFTDRVERALAVARRDGSRPVVMLVDLDHFKEVNDSLGHHHGDELLRQVGPRIARALRTSDTVARLGGDEFAVLLTGETGVEAGAEVAAKVLVALAEPFAVLGVELEIGASLGVAAFPEHGEDVETLLRRADVAMYTAKGAGGGHRLPSTTAHARQDAIDLVGDLRRAMDDGELSLVFQPKVDLLSGDVRGAEALVRWRHPERGLVPPASFIGHADHAGLMRPLTLYVLDAALAQAAAWHEEGLDLRVAVNVSSRSLLDRALPGEIERLLEVHGVPARVLELELTEAALMSDPARAATVLADLHALGVGLSIDDFGTGWTSLGALGQLPVDEIKIDRSFVVGMGHDIGDVAVVRSAIDLARNLGVRVVAEGVADEQVRRRLAALGCDLGQGYLFSAPVPGDALGAWASARAAAAAAIAEAAL